MLHSVLIYNCVLVARSKKKLCTFCANFELTIAPLHDHHSKSLVFSRAITDPSFEEEEEGCGQGQEAEQINRTVTAASAANCVTESGIAKLNHESILVKKDRATNE
jgi:hypothetical protein